MITRARNLLIGLGIIAGIIIILSFDYSPPDKLAYGVSFSRFHADELKLDWKEVYLAILDDLKVRNFRFSAHWPLTEPEEGKYNFSELDFQMEEARKRDASVILAVGRRLPGWPECHEPEWVKKSNLSKEIKQEKILKYIETVVNRYKKYENIKYWQVENEPFLTFFSHFNCGDLDREFLRKEIDFVKTLDPLRPVLVTDSGEFGLWFKAHQDGDVFGTSMYLYIWNRRIGPFRYPITPAFFRIKQNLVSLFFGNKPIILIELSAEPWLLQPIIDTSMDIQLDRMGIDKLNEMIDFAKKSGFDSQYLWGAEWWYWMKLNGHNEFWDRAKALFSTS